MVRHLTGMGILSKQAIDAEQECARSDFSLDATRVWPQENFGGSHVVGCGNFAPLLLSYFGLSRLSLLRNLEQFGVNEIHALRLVDDGAFLLLTLPFGEYLRNGRSWKHCNRKIVERNLPTFH